MKDALRTTAEQFAAIGERYRTFVEPWLAMGLLALLLAPILWPVYAMVMGIGWTLIVLWFALWAWIILLAVTDPADTPTEETP